MLVTLSPIVFRSRPVLEAIMPFPTPEITPEVVYHFVSHSHPASLDNSLAQPWEDLISKRENAPMPLTSGN